MTVSKPSQHYWRIKNDELTTIKQTLNNTLQQTLPEQFGAGYTNIFPLADDVSVIETHYRPNRNLAILNQVNYHEPRMVITLALAGNSRFNNKFC